MREAFGQRRPYQSLKVLRRRRICSERFKRIAEASNDAFLWICQSAVEIEYHVHWRAPQEYFIELLDLFSRVAFVLDHVRGLLDQFSVNSTARSRATPMWTRQDGRD